MKKVIKVLIKRNKEVIKLINMLEENTVVKLGILGCKEHMIIELCTTGSNELEKNNIKEISLSFKHIDYAYKVLTARQSIANCYKEKNMFSSGNIPDVMIILEILIITQKTILPRFICKRLFDNMEKIDKKYLILAKAICTANK